MRVFCTLLMFVLFFVNTSEAQVIIKNGSVSACGGVFYDSGGESGNYKILEDYTFTICSNNPQKSYISLDFEYMDLGLGDQICFYDGPNINSPVLACASSTNPLKSYLIQATSRNKTGCITVHFTSNLLFNGKGWAANISCIPACQPITAVIDGTVPTVLPKDTGYIDLCLSNAKVNFKAHGEYPQNKNSYTQSDSLSKFEWNFGDGSPIVYGTDVSHTFSKSGGFNVRLTIIDTVGCKNINYIKQRVRVAPKPTFNASNLISQVCAGTEVKLKAKADVIDQTFDVSFTQTEGSFLSGTVRSGRLFIPDDGTQIYKTSMTFSDFDPGQVLTNVNDILKVFVDIEHSWARDLEIKLICPSQQSVILHKYQGQSGNRISLGTPSLVDDPVLTNDSTLNIPGIPGRYNWVSSATRTWNSYTTPDPVNLNPNLNYKPDESMNQLLGCPLNGTWSLEVRDLWPKDNGWIFAWGIDFNKGLYPTLETFKTKTTDHYWLKHPLTTSINGDVMTVKPRNPGEYEFQYEIKDNFGCTYDTTVVLNVMPPSIACASIVCDLDNYIERIKDTTICRGGTGAVLDKTYKGKLNQSITFETFPGKEIDAITAPPATPYSSSINVLNVANSVLLTPSTQLDSVCFDISSANTSDLVVDLKASSGQTIRLFNRRGGVGAQHSIKNLCFAPSATKDIATSPSPYSGLYQPEGGSATWNALTGAIINGAWQLLVSDTQGTEKDTVNRWSITFRNNNGLKYTWTPATGLSCTNCANPTATPSVTTTYFVDVVDSFACVHRDTVVVNVIDSLETPKLSVSNLNYTFIIFEWQPVAGATGYEVSINGGTWIYTNNLNYTVNNLKIGENVNFRVRAVGASCGAKIAMLNQATKTCSATIGNGFFRQLEIDSILCYGMNSPRVNFKYANGEPPLTFQIDNIVQVAQAIFFDTIKAGLHRAIVTDAVGCSDTLDFYLGQPNPVSVTVQTVDLKCAGSDDGQLTVRGSGGVGNYEFQVRGNVILGFQKDSVFTGLSVGPYEIEVQDSNFCSAITNVELIAPAALDVQLYKLDNNCFGESAGEAEAVVTGGTQPYTWLWNTGDTTQRIVNLKAGTVSVTVTDGKNCQFTGSIDIEEGSRIVPLATGTDPKCFGEASGVVRVEATGGLPSYIFQWNTGEFGDSLTNVTKGTYMVTVIDGLGCTDSATVTLNEPDSLNFDSITTTPTVCSSSPTGTASVVVSGGTAPYDYLWAPNFETTSNITGLIAGTYTVTVVDANGCPKIAEAVVTSPSNLSIDRFTTVSPRCFGDTNGSITANVSGGVGNISYQWNTSDTTTSIQNLVAGKYTLTIMDANGCTFSKDTTLTQPSLLVASLQGVTNVKCFGDTDGRATPSVTGGTTFNTGLKYQYRWNDSTSQTTASASNLGVGSYILTVTDANGCSDTVNATITGPAAPLQATAIATKIACFGQNSGAAMVSATGGTPGYKYIWSDGSSSVNAANLNPRDYYVTVTDINGCSAIDTIAISTYPNITVAATILQPRCYGDANGTITLNSVVGGAGSGTFGEYIYSWSTGSSQTSTQATNLRGNRNYSLTVTDTAGCQTTRTYFMPEPIPVTVNATTVNASCYGRTDGQATVNVTGGGLGYKYQWSSNAFNQTAQTANNLPAGTYYVTVTEDSTGCKATTNAVISEPSRIKIDNTLVKPASCSGSADGKLAVVVSGGVPTYTYAWSNGKNTLTIDNLIAGAYSFSVTDASGCSASQTYSVVAPNALDGEVSFTNVKCFGGSDGVITVDAFGGTPPYSFSANDGKSYTGSSSILGLKIGNYSVVIKDAKNCIWKQQVSIASPPQLVIKAMPDVTIQLGDSVQLSAQVLSGQGSSIISWKAPYDGILSCKNCEKPIASPQFTTVYAVFATDSIGCKGSDSVKVIVEKPRLVFVPTGFSPNGDTNNDNLYVRGKNGTKVLAFRVYDRWGELIHEARDFGINDPNAGWDGKFKGQPMPPGVYVWYVEAQYLDGAKEMLKGSTTLIR